MKKEGDERLVRHRGDIFRGWLPPGGRDAGAELGGASHMNTGQESVASRKSQMS